MFGAIALVLAGGGAGAYVYVSKSTTAEAGKDKAAPDAHAEAKRDAPTKPIYIPFESFTVNLNDKENERFAQMVFVVEVADAATGEQVKTQMPAIRGRVLSLLSSKTSSDLKGREGKEKLAVDILAEARLAMGLSAEDKSLREIHFSQFVMQ